MTMLELKATAQVHHDTLHVHYAVKNLQKVPVYLFDVAFGPGASLLQTFSKVTYTPPETVVFESTLSGPPVGTAWAAPPTAYAARIAPGETLERERLQPLPLRTSEDPFALPPRLDGPLPPAPSVQHTRCKHLQIVLGYVAERNDLGISPAPTFGSDVYTLRAAALDHQQLTSTDLADINVSLEHP